MDMLLRILNRSMSTKQEVVPIEAILDDLQVFDDDRACLFAICLLDGIISNDGKINEQG